MKRSLMLAAAISAFVVPAAAPLTASAQDAPLFRSREDIRAARRADEAATATSEPRQERREERQERRADRQEARTAPPAPPAAEERQERREERRSERQESLEERAQRRPNEPLYRDRQDVLDARAAEARGEAWRPRDRSDDRERRGDRREDRREYRDHHRRFNSDNWHRDYGRRYDSGWWRYDRRFRDYRGVRSGFYFAPSYGYYQVPRQYWGRRYYEGQYLPSIFWRYRLDDWRTYGLGYPPAGTRWVLVDNQIYLIDEYDGYIVDVIYDAWSW